MRKETRQTDQATYYLRYYDSWMDFLSLAEHVERHRKKNIYGGLPCASLKKDNEDWSGTSSLAEAIKIARSGWPEGVQQLREMRERLTITRLLPHSHRIKTTRDVSGDEPDIDLFLRNEPENMTTMWENPIAERGKIIRIILSRSVAWFIPSDEILRKGVAMLLAFETLIQLGYSPEVIISFAGLAETTDIFDSQEIAEHYVPILHAGDPINLDTLAFMFLHPAVLRRLWLAASECETKEMRLRFGYYDAKTTGYSAVIEPSLPPPSDLIIGPHEGLLNTDEQIIAYTLEILKRVSIDTGKLIQR